MEILEKKDAAMKRPFLAMNDLSILAHDIFLTSFFIFLAGVFLESIKKGLVVSVINLNAVLLICLGSGFLTALLPQRDRWHQGKLFSGVVIFITSGVGVFFIYDALNARGIKSLSLAIAGGVCIFILGMLTMIQRKGECREEK